MAAATFSDSARDVLGRRCERAFWIGTAGRAAGARSPGNRPSGRREVDREARADLDGHAAVRRQFAKRRLTPVVSTPWQPLSLFLTSTP